MPFQIACRQLCTRIPTLQYIGYPGLPQFAKLQCQLQPKHWDNGITLMQFPEREFAIEIERDETLISSPCYASCSGHNSNVPGLCCMRSLLVS
jgi:hypothetical protein